MGTKEHSEAYAIEWQPAIPVIGSFRILSNVPKWSKPIRAIVDSGADRSFLPEHLVNDVLEYLETTVVRVEGVGSEARTATAVFLRFEIGEFDQGENWFVLLGDEPILGRDVLNKYRATLDGPPIDGDHARVTLCRVAHD